MSNNYSLFLDDYRHWRQVYPELGNRIWVTVKNVEEFKQVVMERGLPDFVSFDHDLYEGHYSGIFNPDEPTGLVAAEWFIEYCRERNMALPSWRVHSLSHLKGTIIDALANYDREFAARQ